MRVSRSSYQQSCACLHMQIMLQAAESCPGGGRELPVCRVHLAATGTRLCSAGAQRLCGAGGVAAGGAHTSTLHNLGGD